MEFSQSTDTNIFAKICVVQQQLFLHRSYSSRGLIEIQTCTDVEPIWVIGAEFFIRASLHNISPYWDIDFSGSFEVRGVGGDECFGAVDQRRLRI